MRVTGRKIWAVLLSLILMVGLFPGTAFAYPTYEPIVTIVPANHSELVPIVRVGDSIGGGTVTSVNGATIKVQCTMDGATGSTSTFRLPKANELWNIASYSLNYISWAGQGDGRKSEGASAMLSPAGCSAYYYFNSVTPGGGGGDATNYLWNFTLQYDANGGTNAPAAQTYGTNSKYEKSHSFTVSSSLPVRDGYTFLGWADTASATTAKYQPGSSCLVSAASIPGYNGGSVTKTIYAVWQASTPPTPPTTYTVTYTDGVDGEVVFADQTTSDLKAGDPTPAFSGTPSREGYTFVRWNPSVAEKVAGNATYSAVWEKIPTYTVTYTDGVDGEVIFADQTTSDLKAGDPTPAFSGTPSREGYTFKGWSPDLATTVEGNATYTAVWEKNSTPATPAPGDSTPSLPQSGQSWWPVWMLSILGVSFLVAGIATRNRNGRKHLSGNEE